MWQHNKPKTKNQIPWSIAGVPSSQAPRLPYYCASICARSSCTWRASSVDSKPKTKKVLWQRKKERKAWGDAVRSRWLRMRLVWGWCKSRDASQPVNLYSVNHRLTRTWCVPLSLVRTWFVPPPVCDHSQGVYFPPNTKSGV